MAAIGYLESPIEYLKGVGPVKAELFKTELGIYTFRDLLFTFPFRYIDRREIATINKIDEEGAFFQFKGELGKLNISGTKWQQRMTANISDPSGNIELVWFQGVAWLAENLIPGNIYIVYGKLSYFNDRKTMAHPELELFDATKPLPTFEPVYNSTEKLNKKGVDSKLRRKLIYALLEKLPAGSLKDNLPDYLVSSLGLISHVESLFQIHLPKAQEELDAAKNRLKFEELFFLQLKLLFLQRSRKANILGAKCAIIGENFKRFYHSHLSFQLTNAQKKVIKEIRADMGSGAQMNRLLQGDVGSGKTIVALMIMLIALDNGFQACLMAPTEILAQQHFLSIKKSLGGMGIEVGLITGSIKGKVRKKFLELLAQGAIHIAIGTHALLENPVEFQNLGIAIIDEQHRFGVAQRANLWNKNKNLAPHILVMTATPIPRTLSMVYFGDLDVSIIDELPPGRKAIKTIHRQDKSRRQVIEFIHSQISEGRQIYIVYPLIEESEKLDLADLNNGYEALLVDFPMPRFQMSILHGRMTAEVKEMEMKRFVDGITQILVATTVIEVGVDVPNASVMVIENTERFGLSQLHQLRGRVGRGGTQSYCILMSGYKLSAQARVRINTMCETNDGFKIAEVDLELRGPGDVDGTRQSGGIEFNIVNLATDLSLLQIARDQATLILEKDASLSHPENMVLKRYLSEMGNKSINWSKIS